MTSIDPPTPITKGAPRSRPVLAEEVFLAWAAHRDEQDIRTTGADRVAHRSSLVIAEIAVARARHLAGAGTSPAVAPPHARGPRRARPGSRRDSRGARRARAASSMRSMPATRSGSGSPSRPGSPHHTLAVGAHEAAAVDDLAQLRVIVHRDELCGVDRHVLRVAPRGDGHARSQPGCPPCPDDRSGSRGCPRGQSREGCGRGFRRPPGRR